MAKEEEKQAMTWKQIKDFCTGLDENQLKSKVMLWREDECISNISAEQLDEDHYVDTEDPDGTCIPESEMDDMIENMDAHANNFTKVYDKGHPILWEDF